MPFPKIEIAATHDNINDYSIDDIKWIEKYQSHEQLKMEMSA